MKNTIWWLVAVLTAITTWFLFPAAVWKYLFFLRVPILMGSFLLLLPVLAKDWLPAMLKNLFVLRGKWQLAFVIVSAVAAGMSVILVSSIILHNAPDRFDVPPAIDISEFWQYVIQNVMAIALSLYICITTINLSQENSETKLQDNAILWGKFAGAGLSIGLLFLVYVIRQWLASNTYLKEILGGIAALFKHGTEGYIDNGELTSGHLTAITFLIIGAAIYLAVGWFFNPMSFKSKSTKSMSDRAEAPALLYVLLLVSMVTLFSGGATFYLDYFRFPVLVLFVLYSAFTYFAFGVDHRFKLDVSKNNEPKDDKKAIDRYSENFKKVLDERLKHQTDERTLVVVCASGGGIQAAGWTAQVLTGLQNQELLGKSFTKAIGLISAVSGGSVGAMYYLDRFGDSGYPELEYTNEQRYSEEKIFRSATKDSLDAVGWGLAYLDFWRFIGLPFLVRPEFDRGTAVEADWQGETKEPQTRKTLATWRKQVFDGKIPIPIFNATVVETGERFLISPMTFGKVTEKKYVDFNTLYQGYNIDIVTAARLSATFPYVSPICRNNRDIPVRNYHFADGGYFDNSGFVTAAQWLDEWLKPEKNLNIKRVLVLQINAFPKSPANEQVQGNGGWFMATLGPLLAMFKVRDPVLASRNAMEADLLAKSWKNLVDRENQVDICYFPIFFPSETDAPEFYKNGQYQPPLSWRLTDREKQAIKDGWDAIKNGKNIQEIKQQWHGKWKMPED